MQTGQYYYNHLPQRIREEFSHNCNVRISYVLNQKYESLSHMIDEAFSAYFTNQGKEYWQHVAQTYKPGLKTKAIVFVEKHSISAAMSASAMLIFSAIILVSAIQNDREKTNIILKKNEELSRRDSINLINRANHIVDSTNAANAIWYPSGAITTDSANSWMDRIMSENKLKQ